jgi:hypothetical protein
MGYINQSCGLGTGHAEQCIFSVVRFLQVHANVMRMVQGPVEYFLGKGEDASERVHLVVLHVSFAIFVEHGAIDSRGRAGRSISPHKSPFPPNSLSIRRCLDSLQPVQHTMLA